MLVTSLCRSQCPWALSNNLSSLSASSDTDHVFLSTWWSSPADGNVYVGWRVGWTCSQKANPLKHIAHQDCISHSKTLRDIHCCKLGGYSWQVWLYNYPATKILLWHLVPATVIGSFLILLLPNSLSGPYQSWPTSDWWTVEWEFLWEQIIDAW